MRFEINFINKQKAGLIVLNPNTSFDGVLSYFAYCKYKEKHSEQEAVRLAQEELPLKKHVFENDFFYFASMPDITVDIPVKDYLFAFSNKISNPQVYSKMGSDFVKKLFSASKMQQGSVGTGPYKCWLVTVKASYFNRVSYVVEVEKEKVDEFISLVKSINAIGKYTRFGFGRFEECEILETDKPIKRYIPVEAGIKTEGKYIMSAIRPPYWGRETVLCGIAEM